MMTIAADPDAHEPLQELVFVVHGTFASNSNWWRPGGEFCEKLNKVLAKKGTRTRCWGVDKLDYFFGWDGNNSERSRTLAAINLAHYLERHLSNQSIVRVHVVAHSHGGNVLLKALHNLMPDHASKIGTLVLLGTPIFDYASFDRPYLASVSYTPDRAPSAITKALAVLGGFYCLNEFVFAQPLFTNLLIYTIVAFFLIIAWVSWSVFLSDLNEPQRNPDQVHQVYLINSQADEAISILNILSDLRKSSAEQARKQFSPIGSLFFFSRVLFFVREYALIKEIGLRDFVNDWMKKRLEADDQLGMAIEPAQSKVSVADVALRSVAEKNGVYFPEYEKTKIHRYEETGVTSKFYRAVVALWEIWLVISAVFSQVLGRRSDSDRKAAGSLWGLVSEMRTLTTNGVSNLVLAVVLSADHVVGSLWEHVTVRFRRLAFSRGVVAVVDAAFGNDSQIEDIRGVAETVSGPFELHAVQLDSELEDEFKASAKTLAGTISSKYYDSLYNKPELEVLAGRLATVFGKDDDAELAHCQYYKNSKTIDIVANLIAGEKTVA